MRPLEIFYGSTIFLLAGLGALISFERFSAELAARVISTPFSIGSGIHQLLFKEQCVGAIRSEIFPEKHLFNFTLNLNIENEKASIPVAAAISCSTNQLDQMTNCGLAVSSGNTFLGHIKLTGPNPIKFDIAAATKLPFSKLTLPGPIEFSTTGGTLQLRGLNSRANFSSKQGFSLSSGSCSSYRALNIGEFTQIAPALNMTELTRRLEAVK